MSKYGAALQTYNNDLVKGIEELRARRARVETEVTQDEREKERLEKEIGLLQAQLSQVVARLDKKQATLRDYDERIAQTEQAYMKILESSQTLLEVLKRYNSRTDSATTSSSSTETAPDSTA